MTTNRNLDGATKTGFCTLLKVLPLKQYVFRPMTPPLQVLLPQTCGSVTKTVTKRNKNNSHFCASGSEGEHSLS